MKCKILRLFSNTLSADGKYSLINNNNLTQRIQMKLSQRQKTFSTFFLLDFWNLVEILNIFKKSVTVIADVFPKLWTQKNVVRSTPKKSSLRGSFEKQHGKCAQICWNLNDRTFTISIDCCEGNGLSKSLC